MKKHIRLLFVTMMSFICFVAFAQEPTKEPITGTVKDVNGESIIGANVSVEGTTLGTITDIDGAFKLDAPENGKLIISFIGYEKQEISINKKTIFPLH